MNIFLLWVGLLLAEGVVIGICVDRVVMSHKKEKIRTIVLRKPNK